MHSVPKTTLVKIKVALNYTVKHNFPVVYGPDPALVVSPLMCNHHVRLPMRTAASLRHAGKNIDSHSCLIPRVVSQRFAPTFRLPNLVSMCGPCACPYTAPRLLARQEPPPPKKPPHRRSETMTSNSQTNFEPD
jgi:hypothetical protein